MANVVCRDEHAISPPAPGKEIEDRDTLDNPADGAFSSSRIVLSDVGTDLIEIAASAPGPDNFIHAGSSMRDVFADDRPYLFERGKIPGIGLFDGLTGLSVVPGLTLGARLFSDRQSGFVEGERPRAGLSTRR